MCILLGFGTNSLKFRRSHVLPRLMQACSLLGDSAKLYRLRGHIAILATAVDRSGEDVNEINPVLWNYNAVDCSRRSVSHDSSRTCARLLQRCAFCSQGALYGGCGKAAQFLVARGGIITVRNCSLDAVCSACPCDAGTSSAVACCRLAGHIPVWDEMLWSIGRGDAFMYKDRLRSTFSGYPWS